MMTKKDFEALAGALLSQRPITTRPLLQWRKDVMAIVNACQDSNTKFDAERFLVAAGYCGEGALTLYPFEKD